MNTDLTTWSRFPGGEMHENNDLCLFLVKQTHSSSYKISHNLSVFLRDQYPPLRLEDRAGVGLYGEGTLYNTNMGFIVA